MRYEHTARGVFLRRENRFVARVLLEGAELAVHVKNTGRLGELLLPGAEVSLQHSDAPGRKYAWDLIAARREGLGWVNIDSQACNTVALDWFRQQSWTLIRPETRYGASRFDFYMERPGERRFVEVKGCTLARDGLGWFPDAPSDRAARHLRELARATREGYRCAVAFVIAMEGITEVLPNVTTDPAFARALAQAADAGVEQWMLPCRVTADTLQIAEQKIAGHTLAKEEIV